jgi:flavin-binding protein dodecin
MNVVKIINLVGESKESWQDATGVPKFPIPAPHSLLGRCAGQVCGAGMVWDAPDATLKPIQEVEATLHGVTRIGIQEFDVRIKDDKVDAYRIRAEVSFRIER